MDFKTVRTSPDQRKNLDKFLGLLDEVGQLIEEDPWLGQVAEMLFAAAGAPTSVADAPTAETVEEVDHGGGVFARPVSASGNEPLHRRVFTRPVSASGNGPPRTGRETPPQDNWGRVSSVFARNGNRPMTLVELADESGLTKSTINSIYFAGSRKSSFKKAGLGGPSGRSSLVCLTDEAYKEARELVTADK